MTALPYDVTEALVQCFGLCFHYKDPVTAFMLSAGVDRALVDKYRHEPKFKWARYVLTDLGQTEEGPIIQRKLLKQMCNMRDLADKDVPNRDAGLDALRKLKTLALSRELIVQKQREKDRSNARLAEDRERVVRERLDKLANLRDQFAANITTDNRQDAGYALEDILVELFSLSEIEYRRSYRTPTGTQQIDGQFTLDGFHYLVEAKWRKDFPTESRPNRNPEKPPTPPVSTALSSGTVSTSVPNDSRTGVNQVSSSACAAYGVSAARLKAPTTNMLSPV